MALPNFIIIGAKKAGTTSLYNYCNEHPEIFMSQMKELRYFGFDNTNPEHRKKVPKLYPITTLDEYKAQFNKVTNEKAIGEASPSYLQNSFAAPNIKKHIPNALLIVSLRNPVDRAYSDYQMNVRHGIETEDIKSAFNASKNWVKAGLYYDQLKKYYDLFGPEKIKVILFDDLTKNSLDVMKGVFGFLQVDTDFNPDVSVKHNPGGGEQKSRFIKYAYSKYKSSRKLRNLARAILPDSFRKSVSNLRTGNMKKTPPLSTSMRQIMLEHYDSDINNLQALIGKDLSNWLKT